MAMTKILLDCTDQNLIVTEAPVIASGGINDNMLVISFSAEWSSLAKSAIFFTSKYKTVYEAVLTNGECTIPAEVLTEPATLYIGVRGVNSDGVIVKTSTLVKFKIVPGAPPADGTTVEPTANVYQQILTAYGKTDNALAKEIAEREREVAVERSRIDALVKLENGSTTGDAELQDIRIGFSGNTHNSAGGAVREQIFNIVRNLDEIRMGKNINVFWRYANDVNAGKVYHHNTGEIISTLAVYSHTDYIPVIPGQTVTVHAPEDDGKCITMIGAYFDENKTVVSGMGMHPNYTSGESVDFVIPDGVYYIAINYHVNHTRESAVVPHEIVAQNLETTKYIGKVWCCVGDSLTEANARAEKHYYDYVAEDLGLTVLNYGVSGTGYKNSSFANRINGSITEDFDFMTIFGSFNDLDSNWEIGEPTDSGTATLCGCMNKAIENFYAKYPTKKLAIITPTPWKTGINYFGVETTLDNMEEYVNALVAVAKRHRLPCLDLYHCSGLNPDNGVMLSTYFNENGVQDVGAHPNSEGHKFIAQKIKEFIKTI